jgi:hypothetical protein
MSRLDPSLARPQRSFYRGLQDDATREWLYLGSEGAQRDHSLTV